MEPSTTRTNGSSLPSRRQVPILHEVVAHFVGEDRIVQVDLGQAGDGAQHDVLDAGLHGGGDGDRISVAAKTGGHPYDVNLGDR